MMYLKRSLKNASSGKHTGVYHTCLDNWDLQVSPARKLDFFMHKTAEHSHVRLLRSRRDSNPKPPDP